MDQFKRQYSFFLRIIIKIKKYCQFLPLNHNILKKLPNINDQDKVSTKIKSKELLLQDVYIKTKFINIR